MDRSEARSGSVINNRSGNLKDLIVCPVFPEEEKTWNALMTRHHYLGFRSLTGQSLKYVVLLDGRWMQY